MAIIFLEVKVVRKYYYAPRKKLYLLHLQPFKVAGCRNEPVPNACCGQCSVARNLSSLRFVIGQLQRSCMPSVAEVPVATSRGNSHV